MRFAFRLRFGRRIWTAEISRRGRRGMWRTEIIDRRCGGRRSRSAILSSHGRRGLLRRGVVIDGDIPTLHLTEDIRASMRMCVVIFWPVVNSTESFSAVGAGARLGHSVQFAIARLSPPQSAIMFRYAAGGFRLLEIRFRATSSFGVAMARFLTVMIRVPVCVRAPRIPRGSGPRAGSALVLVSQFFAGRYFFPFASLRGGGVVTRQYAAFFSTQELAA